MSALCRTNTCRTSQCMLALVHACRTSPCQPLCKGMGSDPKKKQLLHIFPHHWQELQRQGLSSPCQPLCKGMGSDPKKKQLLHIFPHHLQELQRQGLSSPCQPLCKGMGSDPKKKQLLHIFPHHGRNCKGKAYCAGLTHVGLAHAALISHIVPILHT
jgi:hypothetical protein